MTSASRSIHPLAIAARPITPVASDVSAIDGVDALGDRRDSDFERDRARADAAAAAAIAAAAAAGHSLRLSPRPPPSPQTPRSVSPGRPRASPAYAAAGSQSQSPTFRTVSPGAVDPPPADPLSPRDEPLQLDVQDVLGDTLYPPVSASPRSKPETTPQTPPLHGPAEPAGTDRGAISAPAAWGEASSEGHDGTGQVAIVSDRQGVPTITPSPRSLRVERRDGGPEGVPAQRLHAHRVQPHSPTGAKEEQDPGRAGVGAPRATTSSSPPRSAGLTAESPTASSILSPSSARSIPRLGLHAATPPPTLPTPPPPTARNPPTPPTTRPKMRFFRNHPGLHHDRSGETSRLVPTGSVRALLPPPTPPAPPPHLITRSCDNRGTCCDL